MKKEHYYSKNRLTAWLCIAGLLILISGCTYFRSDRKVRESKKQGSTVQFPSAYLEAVRDAANPEPDEVYDRLIPVAASNTKLVRKTFDGEQYILVVTWVGNASYYKITDQDGFYHTQGFDIWVTVAPELQQQCADPEFGSRDLEPRLKQLLGMPPNTNKTDFVELWVRPQDLFRPCPDAQINDSSCGLGMPEQTSTSHRAWFNRYRAKSYCHSENCKDLVPYPWTQLGYTYDWGNPETEVGLSEFVIKQNSKVIVNDIVPNRKYCHRD
jgi:hypothetical protein